MATSNRLRREPLCSTSGAKRKTPAPLPGVSNRMSGRSRLGRDEFPSGGGDDAELNKHAQLIDDAPMLNDSAVGDAPDVDLGPRCAPAGGGHAVELTGHGAGAGQERQ